MAKWVPIKVAHLVPMVTWVLIKVQTRAQWVRTRARWDLTRDQWVQIKDKWDLTRDPWDRTRDQWGPIRDKWYLTRDRWDLTRDKWDLTRDKWALPMGQWDQIKCSRKVKTKASKAPWARIKDLWAQIKDQIKVQWAPTRAYLVQWVVLPTSKVRTGVHHSHRAQLVPGVLVGCVVPGQEVPEVGQWVCVVRVVLESEVPGRQVPEVHDPA